jgi:hypothetical protein
MLPAPAHLFGALNGINLRILPSASCSSTGKFKGPADFVLLGGDRAKAIKICPQALEMLEIHK